MLWDREKIDCFYKWFGNMRVKHVVWFGKKEQSEHQKRDNFDPWWIRCRSLFGSDCVFESLIQGRNRGGGGTSQYEQRAGPWCPRMDWMDGATFLPFSSTIAPRCRVSLQRADSLYAAFSRDFTTPSFAHTPLARLHNMFEPIARTILAGTQHTAQGKI